VSVIVEMNEMSNMIGRTTTITLLRTTVERLKKLGHKGQTYDEIVQRLLEVAEKEGAE